MLHEMLDKTQEEPLLPPSKAETTAPVSRRNCVPSIIELTTELSVLELHCPFCGVKTYDWASTTAITPCPHLIGVSEKPNTEGDHNHQLGDIIFCICDSGPRPEMLLLTFRDQNTHKRPL